MKTSYRKFALTLLVAAMLPFASLAQVSIPGNVQQLAQQVAQNPGNQSAVKALAAAIQDLIEAEGLGSIDDIAEALVSQAGSAAEASALAEAVALAAVLAAADTPGADVAAAVAAANRGARRGAASLGGDAQAAVSNGVVAGATAGAFEVGVSPDLVLAQIGDGAPGGLDTPDVPNENPALTVSAPTTTQG